MFAKRLGVSAILQMLCILRFSKSFSRVYYADGETQTRNTWITNPVP